jgi:dihydrolipoamide dehydrogenase
MFDVCVIGGGPSGYAAAMRALDLGKSVCLIERSRLGGTGIRNGALSSKTLWHLSNDYARATRSDRGYRLSGLELDYNEVMRCVEEAVSEREGFFEVQAAQLSGITLCRGTATFTSPFSVKVTAAESSVEPSRIIEAKNFLIATGSTPRIPGGVEVDGTWVMTSDHIERMGHFPESLVVVGAGVVGCEYATIFANFGVKRIHIVDRQPRILPFEDEDVSELVARNFQASGIQIHRAATLRSLVRAGSGVVYEIESAEKGVERIEVERALVSIGRIANTRSLGLEEIGVKTDAMGNILTTHTQSSVPHIYAAGDVTPDVALVNIAELEGRFAVEQMFGGAPTPIRYDALSAIMFLKPEVASVGLNEIACKKQGIRYRVGVVSNLLVARNVAMRATDGFIKLVVEAAAPHKILGLRVVGPQAASTVQGTAFLIERGANLSDIEHCIHPHPAIPEGVQECARLLLGRGLFKPEVFPGLLRVAEG